MTALRPLLFCLYIASALGAVGPLAHRARVSRAARLRGGSSIFTLQEDLAARLRGGGGLEEVAAAATPQTTTKILTVCCALHGLFLTVAPQIAGKKVARQSKTSGDDNDAPTITVKRLIWNNGMSMLSLATTALLLAFIPQDGVTLPTAAAAGIVPRACVLIYCIVPSLTVTLDFAAIWFGFIMNIICTIALVRPEAVLKLKLDPSMAMKALAILYLASGLSALILTDNHGKAILEHGPQAEEQQCLRAHGKTDLAHGILLGSLALGAPFPQAVSRSCVAWVAGTIWNEVFRGNLRWHVLLQILLGIVSRAILVKTAPIAEV